MDKRRFILYLLHMGLMLIIVSVHHTIPTLPVGGERKTLFGGCKKGGHIVSAWLS